MQTSDGHERNGHEPDGHEPDGHEPDGHGARAAGTAEVAGAATWSVHGHLHRHRTAPLERFDVVVVGAGVAGVTAAAVAARGGSSVLVIDARRPGGRARTTERDGYLLNDGGHALYERGPGAAVLRELGVDLPGGAPPLDRYCTWWDGAVHPLPVTPAGLAATRLLGVRSKLAAGRLFAGVGGLARTAGDGTLAEWMDDRRMRGDLRTLLCTVLRLATYSAEPELAPAAAMLRQLAQATGGVRYLDGGWRTIVDGVLGVATAAGARVVTGSPVTSLHRDGADWVVETGGTGAAYVAADVVLASGSPAAAEALVGREVGWSALAGPPVRAACLDVGVGPGTIPPVSFLFSADDPLYLSAHAPTARLAPDGHRLYSVMRYLRTGEHLDRHDARAELERHAARAGLPAPGERTVDRFLAEMVVTHGSPTIEHPRPRGDELAAEGVHVAGDWIGDHLLADAAFDSGARAGRAVAARRRAAA
jgi:glycine/D-amino acid oxidase-like deaminating enzyme